MSRISLPRVREVLQVRESRVTADLQKAESLKDEAQKIEAEFLAVVEEAKSKAQTMMQQAHEKAKEEETKRFQKLEETFAKQSKTAEGRVVELRKESAEKLLPVTIDATHAILHKLVGVDVDKKEVERVVANVGKNIE